MSRDVEYLIVDIETVVDALLVYGVKYFGEPPCDPVARYEEELRAAGKDPFIPPTYHVPAVIGVAKVLGDLSMTDLVALDGPPADLTSKFWRAVQLWEPTLVTFNGRGFDLPVLACNALRHGVACPPYFLKADYTHRYSGRHLDLMDWFTNHGAWRLAGGLELCSRLCGGPGKSGGGASVAEMYNTGRLAELKAYCLRDVVETYRLLLRSKVLQGALSREREAQLMATAEEKLCRENQSSSHP